MTPRVQSLRSGAAAILIAWVMALGACKETSPSPVPAASATPLQEPLATVSRDFRRGPLYPVNGLDLCKQTRLEALAAPKVQIVRAELNMRAYQDSGEGRLLDVGKAEAACLFDLRTATGRAWMTVAVSTLESVQKAKEFLELLRTYRESRGMSRERLPSGIGEEADAFSLESPKGEMEYVVVARVRNRQIEVKFSDLGKPLMGKERLAETSLAVLLSIERLAAESPSSDMP